MTERQTGGDGPDVETRQRGLWWWLALALAVGTAVITVGSFVDDDLRVCEDVVLPAPSNVVTLCRPIQLPDAWPVFPLLIVLLYPEVAEMTIPGVLHLKKRVDEQAQKQIALEHAVSQIQNTNVRTEQRVILTNEKLEHLVEKEELFAQTTDPDEFRED
ncbi:MAG: hypothetical protein M3273_03395 [Actinomycetota bacterium]|nr:hypothetical protein [Actinomycetota bacterium]